MLVIYNIPWFMEGAVSESQFYNKKNKINAISVEIRVVIGLIQIIWFVCCFMYPVMILNSVLLFLNFCLFFLPSFLENFVHANPTSCGRMVGDNNKLFFLCFMFAIIDVHSVFRNYVVLCISLQMYSVKFANCYYYGQN